MPGKYFIDTNIIVYAFDRRDRYKWETANRMMGEALETHKGIVSFQVIQEFANVSLQKFRQPLKPRDCKIFISNFLAPLCQIYPSPDLYNEAVNLFAETGLGFYDSLIVAAAVRADCQVLYSEDLTDGQIIRSVKIVNPFKK